MFSKTLAAAAFGVIALANASYADEAPFLYGNYSASVLDSYNGGRGVAPQISAGQEKRGFGYSSSRSASAASLAQPRGMTQRDDRPVGNYSENIRIDDIRGGL